MTNNKLKLDRVIITPQQVLVASTAACTSHVNEKRREHLSIDELLGRYQRIIRLAKQRNISLSLRKKPLSMKRRIEELQETYDDQMDIYNELFDSLVEAWRKVVTKGIYQGRRNDPEYRSAVAIAHKLSPMTAHSRPIGQAIDINNELNRCLDSLNKTNVTKIWL